MTDCSKSSLAKVSPPLSTGQVATLSCIHHDLQNVKIQGNRACTSLCLDHFSKCSHVLAQKRAAQLQHLKEIWTTRGSQKPLLVKEKNTYKEWKRDDGSICMPDSLQQLCQTLASNRKHLIAFGGLSLSKYKIWVLGQGLGDEATGSQGRACRQCSACSPTWSYKSSARMPYPSTTWYWASTDDDITHTVSIYRKLKTA